MVSLVRQRGVELPAHHGKGFFSLALFSRFAQANDRHEAGPMHGQRLAPHQLVGFAMKRAAFGVADDDGARAGIGQHFRRNVAGEDAGCFRMAILRADHDPRSGCRGGEFSE